MLLREFSRLSAADVPSWKAPRLPRRSGRNFHDDPRVEYVRADLTERDSGVGGLVADCVGAVLCAATTGGAARRRGILVTGALVGPGH